MTYSEYEHLTRNVRGGYTSREWAVVDSDGLITTPILVPGRYLVVEDPYACTVFTIDSHNHVALVGYED